MANDMNRRDLLATAASVAVGSGDLAPYARRQRPVEAPSADAELLELGALFFAALARRDHYDNDGEDALNRCRHVEIPDALFLRDGDESVCGFRELARYKVDGEWREAFERGVGDLNLYAQRYAKKGDACGIETKFFSEAARARTLEIQAVHAAWKAEIARAEADCGFTASCEASGRETELMKSLRLRIAALEAGTLDGLATKARIASKELSYEPGWAESTWLPGLLRDPVPDADWSASDPLLVSLVIDAIKIGTAPAGRSA